jgi:hypothetical protein
MCEEGKTSMLNPCGNTTTIWGKRRGVNKIGLFFPLLFYSGIKRSLFQREGREVRTLNQVGISTCDSDLVLNIWNWKQAES